MEIQVLGAAGEVTGSCTLLSNTEQQILIDCGAVQGSDAAERRNRSLPDGVEPDALTAVVLTHAHLDHSGRLPLLIKNDYKGPIFATAATKDVARIILMDAARLQKEDAKHRRKHGGGSPTHLPTFTEEDVLTLIARITPVAYGREVELCQGVQATFHDAGHILGSAIIELSSGEHTLVFSGDLGPENQPLLPPPTKLHQADFVMMESTYGDRDHRDSEQTLAELEQILRAAQETGGKVLIPAFAIGRSQRLLFHLREFGDQGLLQDMPVYLDTPMGIAATAIYERYPELYDPESRRLVQGGTAPMKLPNLTLLRSANDSRALNDLDEPAVIIAGAGMMGGGRIIHHLVHQGTKPETHLVVSGFQAAGTLGRAIVEGRRQIRVMGTTIHLRAQVHTIGGLSAHAGRSELLDWISQFAAANPLVVLNHGEPAPRSALASAIRTQLHFNVQEPESGTTYDLSQ